MWEKAKTELDAMFRKSNKIIVERRRTNRWNEFSNHLDFLQSFAALQATLIRPGMTDFGKYVESMGHKYYIESAEQLVEGYLLPVSHVSLHILLNVPRDLAHTSWHSLTFKTDSARCIYIYRKNGGYGAEKTGLSAMGRHAVGRYDLPQLTHEVVESHLKNFLLDAILKPQQAVARSVTKASFLDERAVYAP